MGRVLPLVPGVNAKLACQSFSPRVPLQQLPGPYIHEISGNNSHIYTPYTHKYDFLYSNIIVSPYSNVRTVHQQVMLSRRLTLVEGACEGQWCQWRCTPSDAHRLIYTYIFVQQILYERLHTLKFFANEARKNPACIALAVATRKVKRARKPAEFYPRLLTQVKCLIDSTLDQVWPCLVNIGGTVLCDECLLV